MLATISLIVLIVLIASLLAVLPIWPYSKRWGFGGSSLLSLMVIILGVMLLLGYV